MIHTSLPEETCIKPHISMLHFSISVSYNIGMKTYFRRQVFCVYRVGIEHTQGEGPGAYITATLSKPPETTQTLEEKPEPTAADSDSDSSS